MQDDFVVFHCIGNPCKATARFHLFLVADYMKTHPNNPLEYVCVQCQAWFSRTIDGCEGAKQLSLGSGDVP